MKPADQDIRDRIKDDLDKTLFVEAGAGTGKTTSLVSRIISLIIGPKRVPITQIAAITFTEKAAIELRNRVRAEINKYLADPQALASKTNNSAVAGAASGDELVALLGEALAGLDSAPISTLHGFARRLLDEHPLEAGLPPSFEVLDEIGSQVDFDTSWSDFVEQMLNDESNSDWLLKIDCFSVSVNHMQALALKFTDNWDLLNWPPYTTAPASSSRTEVFEDIAKRALDLYGQRDQCQDRDDKLYAKFEVLPEFVRRLKACRNDLERLTLLTNGKYVIPKIGNAGKKDNWPNVEDIRDKFRILRSECDRYLAEEASDAVHSCVEQLRRFALQLAKERQSVGRLSFQDLLVVCRNLLRSKEHGVTVRQALHRRYSHLLLDEFHDTDPIQIEIATLIASPVAASNTGRTASCSGLVGDWIDLVADDGHLFFVGDPKQSIYRFRRADIKLYHKAQERFGGQLGETLNLSVNFRSSKPIICWINHAFESLMKECVSYEDLPDVVFANEDEAKQALEGLKANYAELEAVRAAPSIGPAVTFLGTEPHEEKDVAEVRASEAKDIAGAIVNICKKEWKVFDRTRGKERSACLDDITILVPSRAALPSLEDALQERHIPYRLESTSFVWSNRAIRDLMMCLRAIADPTNELATVSALRSAIYGCGDDDLFRHKVINGGSWNYRAASYNRKASNRSASDRNTQPDPVISALAHLNELHDLSAYQTPAELIEQLVFDRQVLEQATAWSGVREQWRHVRFLVDQARAWSESQQSGLRRFLLWANGQSSDNARVTEPVLPELDDEAVHVMTMHASKGLEFPIVILAGLQETVRKESDTSDVMFVSKDEPPAVRFVGDAKSTNYDKWSEVEALADHYERIRKLYVACTRACDHLVISAHRKQVKDSSRKKDKSSKLRGTTSAQLLIEASEPESGQDPRFEVSDFLAGGSLPVKFSAPAKPSSKRPELERWEQNRNSSLAASKKAAWLSASSIARRSSDTADSNANKSAADRETVAEDTEDADGSATNRSRYGGATFGSAVHGVLEKINLAAAVKAVANAAANAATNAAAGTDGDSQADPEAGSEAESEADREINAKITNLSKSQAEEKGVPGLAKEVKQRVRKVLAHPTVQAAAQARHWQEVYVGALAGTQDHTVVDGFIDLLYEDPTGADGASPRGASPAGADLVVLDFKTTNTSDETVLRSRTKGYLLQGATYAYCVQRSTGRAVSRVEFAYLSEDDVVIHTVEGDELAAAIDKVVEIAQQVDQ